MKRFHLALAAVLVGSALAVTPAVAGNAAVDSGCSAVAVVGSQWGSGPTGGQVITVTVTNTSAVTTPRWSVKWTVPAGQGFAAIWNATATISGAEVTAVNNVYNGELAPGRTALFGVRLAGVGPPLALQCDSGIPVPAGSAPPTEVTVGVADHQATVRLRTGDTLVVSLTDQHLPPAVSTPGVLTRRQVAGGYSTGWPLVARYVAAAPGTTDVTTRTDYPCSHDPMPCAMPYRPWLVHVIVS